MSVLLFFLLHIFQNIERLNWESLRHVSAYSTAKLSYLYLSICTATTAAKHLRPHVFLFMLGLKVPHVNFTLFRANFTLVTILVMIFSCYLTTVIILTIQSQPNYTLFI